jgi:hypothetical protein
MKKVKLERIIKQQADKQRSFTNSLRNKATNNMKSSNTLRRRKKLKTL